MSSDPRVVIFVMPTDPWVVIFVMPTDPWVVIFVMPTDPWVVIFVMPTDPCVVIFVMPTDPRVVIRNDRGRVVTGGRLSVTALVIAALSVTALVIAGCKHGLRDFPNQQPDLLSYQYVPHAAYSNPVPLALDITNAAGTFVTHCALVSRLFPLPAADDFLSGTHKFKTGW